MPDSTESKRCTRCGETKPLTAYYRDGINLRANCKECHKAAQRQRRADNPEHVRALDNAHYAATRAQHIQRGRAFWDANKDRLNAERRAARAANPEPIRAQAKAWRDANIDRARATQRKSHAKHRERQNAALRAYRAANPAKHRAYQAAHRQKHRAAIRERNRRYYQANRDVFARHRAKRKARLMGVEHVPYTRTEIYHRDGGQCCICNTNLQNIPGGFQIDHIVPISLGGPDTPANVQLTCAPCNRRKWASLDGQIHLPV